MLFIHPVMNICVSTLRLLGKCCYEMGVHVSVSVPVFNSFGNVHRSRTTVYV